ncbi:MAG: pyrrolo-quinoline quinone, partial [Phycisphaerae bacterium]|nr:pyrrolo-quinoline quinone [Phycisphaerae bacterium]
MRRICIIATVALALSSSIARGEDWSQWGGDSGRNMASGAKNMPLSFGPGKLEDGTRRIDMSKTRNVMWAIVLGSQ